MRSTRPKVLQTIGGQSLIAYVLEAVRQSGSTAVAVVIGPGVDSLTSEA